MNLNNLKKIIKNTYTILMILGISMLSLAILPVWKIMNNTYYILLLTNEILNNILISLGCGLITSVIVTMLCERANERRKIEEKELMKSNILMDFNELINYYFEGDFEYVTLRNILESKFIFEANDKIQQYLLLGIMFYNPEEFKYLNLLQGYSESLCRTIKMNDIKKLYDEYSEVFDEAVLWDYTMGPYSNEQKVFKVCSELRKSISTINADNILEFVCVYLMYRNYIKKFKNVFNYIKINE